MSLRIYGNRALKTLPGHETRPTLARVRAAVFNIWQGAIADCGWLDLCAGSGSMGAEALCRGAERAIAIEQSSRACAVIQQNWQQVAQPHQSFQVIRGDVVKKLPTLAGQGFDRIYCDPPYASALYQPIVDAIAQLNLLAPNGEMALEHSSDGLSLILPPTLAICRHKTYGNTSLTFLQNC
ncbi:MAG: 16S rRNA (guanine(966)-N(2))-methyltransferase RsmD [Leptolyngbyaceae cyanobacterium bins.349]|nr:16S rRNA (guanine(966)-N(2))-methyltransferase RsmD [Leptolyngbyaceae cyanobacterium bins.349]